MLDPPNPTSPDERARLLREKRRQKILERGADRLAQITGNMTQITADVRSEVKDTLQSSPLSNGSWTDLAGDVASGSNVTEHDRCTETENEPGDNAEHSTKATASSNDHTPKVPCTSERTSQIRKRVASPQSPSSIRNPVSEASTHILLNASHSLRRSREVSEDAPTPNPDVITDLYNNEKLLVGLESNTDQGSSSLFPERTAAPLFEWVHMIVAFLFSIRSVYSLSLLIVDSEDESTGVSPSFSQLLSRLGTVQDIHVETPTVYGWGMTVSYAFLLLQMLLLPLVFIFTKPKGISLPFQLGNLPFASLLQYSWIFKSVFNDACLLIFVLGLSVGIGSLLLSEI